MSQAPLVKELIFFIKARMNTQSAKMVTAECADANNMADKADVLAELKALRSEFGSKLDGINNRLHEMA